MYQVLLWTSEYNEWNFIDSFFHSVATFRWFLNKILYNPNCLSRNLNILVFYWWQYCHLSNCHSLFENWLLFHCLWAGHGTGLNSCFKCWTGRAITCLFCQSRNPQGNYSAMYWLTRNGQSRFCQPLRSSVSKLKMIFDNCKTCKSWLCA